jgi:hypothetical protein
VPNGRFRPATTRRVCDLNAIGSHGEELPHPVDGDQLQNGIELME